MVGHKYTAEEHEFLNSFVPGHTYSEIITEFNKRFSEPITRSRLKGYIGNHKLNTGKTGRFEKGHIPHNKGLHTPTVGRMAETQFKKGRLPHNTKEIGYERITKDGYIEVKVTERPDRANGIRNFIPKHRLVWEAANGPIPDNCIVVFLDGDKTNCNLDNLALITRAEHLELTRRELRNENPQLTKTGILVAKAGIAVCKARKNNRKER